MPQKPRRKAAQESEQLLAAARETDLALAKYYQSIQAAADEVSEAQTVRRGSSAATTNPFGDRFKNIQNSIQPFWFTDNNGYITAYDTINIAVKAYYSFGLLRQIVETMVELASSKIYLKKGNKKTREFIEAWMEKIQIDAITEQFFREFWRSGNPFILRYDAKIRPEDIKELETLYSGMGDSIPLKYTILNPLYLTAQANLNYETPKYLRKLEPFEVKRILDPKTEEDKAIKQSLPADIKRGLKAGAMIPLDPQKLTVILYKAQPYDPWGVPLVFPVLENIEARKELERIDLAVARTTDRLLLLITMGKEATEHDKTTVNGNTMAQVQTLFNTGSITRTLVADYTTKAQWIVPDINKILGEEKYKSIDRQINIGLNAIFFDSSEKFANTSIKVQIFVEKLKEARKVFIKKFLQPEINRVCKIINAKAAPEAHFEDISLKDELQFSKLTLAMYSAGLLTPEEAFDHIETGKLPTVDESLENQKKFAEQKEQNLYAPVLGGSVELQRKQTESNIELGKEELQIQKNAPKPAGRPAGTKAPQSSKKVKPIGASTETEAEEKYSFAALKDLSWSVSELQDETEKALRKRFKVKELDENQVASARNLVEAIICNESQDNWKDSLKQYLKSPKEINEEVAREVDDICVRHSIPSYAAAIIRLAAIK